jgi:signal transduction histidine kinase
MFSIPAFPQVGIIIVAMCIVMGVLTFSYSSNRKISLSFTLSTFLSALWILINTVLLPLRFFDLYLLVRISFAVAMLTMLSIWSFIYGYGDAPVYGNKKRPINFMVYFLSLSLSITSLISPLIITDTYYRDDSLILGFGPLYYLYALALVFTFILITVTLYLKAKRSDGQVKLQLNTFLKGFSITASISLGTNLIIPLMSTDSNSSRIGPFAMIFFLTFTFYAIIQHRLFDIRIIIGRLIYYLTLSFIPYTVFFVVAALFLYLYKDLFRTEVFLLAIPIAVAFVVIFNRVNEAIRNQITLRFINPGYNPLTAGESFNKKVSAVISLEKILDETANTIKVTIRPSSIRSIIIKESDKSRLVIQRVGSDPEFKIEEIKYPQLKSIWETVGLNPLVLDQLKEALPREYVNIPNLIAEVIPFMVQNNIKVIIPLGTESARGFLALGSKEADAPYNSQDIAFLTTLGANASSALERSFLYEEVQEFNRTLQRKVDDATSELKKTNTQLGQTLNQVQELRRQERDMIDVMGHELRTPISIVRNALVMLQMQTNAPQLDPTKVSKYVDMGLESARREIKLIETLLSATKIEGNRIQLDFTKVDLLDVVNDSLEGTKGVARGKNLNIVYDKPKEPIYIYCDRVRVQEIMDNFLSNALKYTQKGNVYIDLKIDPAKGMAYASVKDTGIGIDMEDLQSLGRKFFRAKQYITFGNNETQQIVRPGGTGLGLYVTFELIRLMNGERDIQSRVGEGSTFTFGMPLYKGQPDQHLDQTFLANGNGSEQPKLPPAIPTK